MSRRATFESGPGEAADELVVETQTEGYNRTEQKRSLLVREREKIQEMSSDGGCPQAGSQGRADLWEHILKALTTAQFAPRCSLRQRADYCLRDDMANIRPITAPNTAPDQGLAVIPQALPEQLPKYPRIPPATPPMRIPATQRTAI
jgi:hypothetical protein